ncbi:MAG: SPOR domain-containing protein [bacterium]
MEEFRGEGGGRLIDDLEPLEDEGGGIKEQIENSNKFAWVSRSFMILLISALVVGAFVLSFVVGKSIFSFVRELPKEGTKVTVTEEPAGDIAPGEKIEVVTPAEVPEKTEPVVPVVEAPVTAPVPVVVPAPVTPKPVVKPVTPAPKPVVTTKPVVKPVAKPVVKPAAKPAAKPTGKLYKVQVGSYNSRAKTVEVANKLKADGLPTFVAEVSPGVYRVQVGAFSSEKIAKNLATQLKSQGYGTIIRTE